METNSAVAQRIWFGIAPDGSEHEVRIGVEAPKLFGAGDWAAAVILEPMDPTRHLIPGADSWQALQLAMKWAGIRVEHFVELGWRFYWERGASPTDASDLFD